MQPKSILPFFSYVFHPLFIPLYAALSFFLIDETYLSLIEKFLLIIQLIIVTILIPGALFLFLRSLGKIDSISANDVNQRKIPLFVQVLLLLILIYQGIILDRIPELYFFYGGAIISTLIALGFAFIKIKISLHMMGLGALLLFVMVLSYYNRENSLSMIAVLMAITGLTGSSRLFMNAHSHKELALGFSAGVLPQMILWGFWL